MADFGIALAASKADSSRMTETGMSLGTPQYMSPEQAMGERVIGPPSDVYALGAVTYEMLTGEPPFSGPTAQAIVAKVMTAEPAEITLLRRTVPVHVADAVHTALQKLPADRFPNATAFAEALGNSAPGRTRVSGFRAAERTGHRGIRLPVMAAIAALALLTGIAAASLFRGQNGSRPAGMRLLMQFPAGQELRAGRNPVVTMAPDGSGVLYIGLGVTSRTQFWFRPWNRMNGERLTRSLDEACCEARDQLGVVVVTDFLDDLKRRLADR